MFENIKAFIQGWKNKGAFPDIPSDLARPYTDTLISYYEDIKIRLEIKMLVCDKREETVAFDFTYDVLPFTMAAVIAHVMANGDHARYRFIDKTLSSFTGYLGRNKPAYEVGRVIRDENEIIHLHQINRLAGAPDSISIFTETSFPYPTLLDIVYPMRAVSATKTLVDVFNRESPKDSILAFSVRLARQFVFNSTICPSDPKISRVALHVASLYFSFYDYLKKPNPHESRGTCLRAFNH